MKIYFFKYLWDTFKRRASAREQRRHDLLEILVFTLLMIPLAVTAGYMLLYHGMFYHRAEDFTDFIDTFPKSIHAFVLIVTLGGTYFLSMSKLSRWIIKFIYA